MPVPSGRSVQVRLPGVPVAYCTSSVESAGTWVKEICRARKASQKVPVPSQASSTTMVVGLTRALFVAVVAASLDSTVPPGVASVGETLLSSVTSTTG